MIVGALASVFGASWKFLWAKPPLTQEEALDVLYALGRRIRGSSDEAELDEIEREIDGVLQTQQLKRASSDEEARDVVALNVAAHRLENLIHDRKLLVGVAANWRVWRTGVMQTRPRCPSAGRSRGCLPCAAYRS
jgi:polyhydroxyalkanoate synthesis regulator phasin